MLLGPIPKHLQDLVRRIGEAVPWPERPIARGILLRGGSGFCALLEDNGTLWIYDAGADEMVAECPDGPEKILEIRLALRTWPQLADWLPKRPSSAFECVNCSGKGVGPHPADPRACPTCSGLGWIGRASDGS